MMCPHCGHQNLPGKEQCQNCTQDMTAFDRPVPDNRLERRLSEDRVDVLSAATPCLVRVHTKVGDALAMMVGHEVGALLVVDDHDRLIGILSERDLLEKVAGVVTDFRDLPVGQFMTPKPDAVEASNTLNYVLRKMDGGPYRHLPVVENGKPVNLISIRDMLHYLMKLCKE